MKTIQDISQLIWNIDHDEALTAYCLRMKGINISFWMLIRYTLNLELGALIGFHCHYQGEMKVNWRQQFKFILNAYQHRLSAQTSDVLFLSPSIGNVDHGQFVENIYHDAFAHACVELNKKAVILEQPNQAWQPFKKHQLNIAQYSLAWHYIKRSLKFKLWQPFFTIDMQKVSDFLALLSHHLKIEKQQKESLLRKVKLHLITQLKRASLDISMWEKIINALQPKIIFMQDICCGGAAGLAALVFKKHRITVIEDQHGLIDKNDIKFNYAEKIFKHDVLAFLPDYFLLYGNIWSQQMRMPSQKVVIGNPYLTSIKTNYQDSVPKFDLLILADSERPDLTIQYSKALLRENYSILFRPHPREFGLAEKRYAALLDDPRLTLDLQRDVYHSIAHVKAVVSFVGSYVSTVAYETIAFGKPVFCCCDEIAAIGGYDLLAQQVHFYEDIKRLIAGLASHFATDTAKNLTNEQQFYSEAWRSNFATLIKCLD